MCLSCVQNPVEVEIELDSAHSKDIIQHTSTQLGYNPVSVQPKTNTKFHTNGNTFQTALLAVSQPL